MRSMVTLALVMALAPALALTLPMLSGCSKDLDALRPLGVAEQAAIDPLDGSVDPVRAVDAGLDANLHAPDATSPPLPARTCGAIGLSCCMPGNACETGVCLRGTCAAFGGSYVSGCPTSCTSRNPYTAGCSCPSGFEAATMSHMMGACGAASATAGDLVLCGAPRGATTADFGGAYVEVAATAACGSGCATPNPLTGACSCGPGSSPIALSYDTPTACGAAHATLVLCASASATALTFAGAYQRATDGACASPNPHTRDCACPPGAVTTAVAATPQPFYVCTL